MSETTPTPVYDERNQLVHFHQHWDAETGEYRGARGEFEHQVLKDGKRVSREYREFNGIADLGPVDLAAVEAAIGKLAVDQELALAGAKARIAELEEAKAELETKIAELQTAAAQKSPLSFG